MELKVYYTKDDEHFVTDDTTHVSPFATGLLDFLYLDFSSEDALSHIFFSAFDVGQLSDAKKRQLIAASVALHKKLETLFSSVFDALPGKEAMSEKLAEYVAAGLTDRYSFGALSTLYEQVEVGVFAEVLYPKSVDEIVEFFVRDCLRRELKFRRCKSCGKYFALTGYSNTEYCDRLFGDSDKTCKEAGAVRLYRTRIIADPKIQAYNRAYKKRFAWIKYKKISKEAFYEWSERARVQRDRCLAGEITLEELEQWLKA
jgi:hypothetical protein